MSISLYINSLGHSFLTYLVILDTKFSFLPSQWTTSLEYIGTTYELEIVLTYTHSTLIKVHTLTCLIFPQLQRQEVVNKGFHEVIPDYRSCIISFGKFLLFVPSVFNILQLIERQLYPFVSLKCISSIWRNYLKYLLHTSQNNFIDGRYFLKFYLF